jgi:hypothetical protein
MPRSRVRAIFPKNDSTRLSHDPCLGVKMNSKRLGTLVRYARVSREGGRLSKCVKITSRQLLKRNVTLLQVRKEGYVNERRSRNLVS